MFNAIYDENIVQNSLIYAVEETEQEPELQYRVRVVRRKRMARIQSYASISTSTTFHMMHII